MRKAAIVCLAALSCAAAEPLPKNAGFEVPDAKGGAEGWSLYKNGEWSVVGGEGRNGTRAVHCANVGKGGWTTQWVELEPGRLFRLLVARRLRNAHRHGGHAAACEGDDWLDQGLAGGVRSACRGEAVSRGDAGHREHEGQGVV